MSIRAWLALCRDEIERRIHQSRRQGENEEVINPCCNACPVSEQRGGLKPTRTGQPLFKAQHLICILLHGRWRPAPLLCRPTCNVYQQLVNSADQLNKITAVRQAEL